MKVKPGSLKKKGLPLSKLLKPKKLKQNDTNKFKPSKKKLTLIVSNNSNAELKRDNDVLQNTKTQTSGTSRTKDNKDCMKITYTSPHGNKLGNSKAKQISLLFDHMTVKPQKKYRTKEKISKLSGKKEGKTKSTGSKGKEESWTVIKCKDKNLKLLSMKGSSTKLNVKMSIQRSEMPNDVAKQITCNLSVNKVEDVTSSLLKLISEKASGKPELLDVAEPILMQLECVKIPICPTKQFNFTIPHPLVDETSDVLLITPDLKGQKIYPEKAIEHYEELLARHEINFITKVMPLRMIRKEYSQYEMRRKLVDQFDVILADYRVIRILPVALGQTVMYKRKMPIPVKLDKPGQDLKRQLQHAVNRTQMTLKSLGHTSIIPVGHSKMSARDIAENIVEVARSLAKWYPGGWINIRSLVIKTAKSTSLPVYFSLVSPNAVRIPVEQRRKPAPVEGELSTMPGVNVIVTADGKVILKKVQEDTPVDDSQDDEILKEAEKYIQSSKTVRHDGDSDEDDKEAENSDNEGDLVTTAMEQKLLNKYKKNVKTKNEKEEEDDADEEEEEEEESEEETEIIPIVGKKRKMQADKKLQQTKKIPKQQENNNQPMKGKLNKGNQNATPGFKKPQMRGSRGGKKNKINKDQRKAMIKRKKAGKK